MTIDLDHNATTRLHPEARRAMEPFLDEAYGNASSLHAAGRRARQAIEVARDQVAALVGGRREELTFTAGGTEANNLAVRGGAHAARRADPRRTRVIVSALEHPSAAEAARALEADGFRRTVLPADARGRLLPEALAPLLGEDVALVSVQLANHELGNLQPVAELAERARAAGAWVHSDAVQAAGKLALDVAALGVDLLTISAHKLRGPKGVGALWARAGRLPEPHSVGGKQERGVRPGTENVAAIVGFGVAAARAKEGAASYASEVGPLRDRLEAGALALGARVHGDRERRVANTTNLAWAGVDGQLLVESLDLEGVLASTGAACSSGSLQPSPVVLALGEPRERAREAVRFSLGRATTREEIDAVLALLLRLVERIRGA